MHLIPYPCWGGSTKRTTVCMQMFEFQHWSLPQWPKASLCTSSQQLLCLVCRCCWELPFPQLIPAPEEQHLHWTLARAGAGAWQLSHTPTKLHFLQKSNFRLNQWNWDFSNISQTFSNANKDKKKKKSIYVIILVWTRNLHLIQNSLQDPYQPLLVHTAKQPLSMQMGFLPNYINLEDTLLLIYSI